MAGAVPLELRFLGVDGRLGRRLAPLPEAELRRRVGAMAFRPRPPRYGVVAESLASAGWGVVFAGSSAEKKRSREALGPLLAVRRAGAGELFRELELFDDEDATDFRSRLGAAFGPVEPRELPWYLLLVGPIEAVPFDLDFELGLAHAVGRLSFEDPEDLAAYARRVARAARLEPALEPVPPRTAGERSGTGPGGSPSRLVPPTTIFAPSHPGDPSTAACVEHLARPWADALCARSSERPPEILLGPRATRERLLDRLALPGQLLLAAGHGVTYRPEDGCQQSRQGALVCADWPGRAQGPRPILAEETLAAADLAPGALADGIGLLFGCHTAGTPRLDPFDDPDPRRAKEIAPKPFVAALPQALLGRGGGALAVLGHVGRAFEASFVWRGLRQSAPLVDVARALLDGRRLGFAVDGLRQRAAHLGATSWRHELDTESPSDREIDVWVATHDALSWTLLGDPAVRLPGAVAEPA